MDEERKVLEISLKDISTDGEKVVIDSPKLARILQAEKGRKDLTRKAITLAPIVPAIPLKETAFIGEKVTIKSRELADIVQAEKDAQKEKMSVVMAPTLPLPPP
jgi:hypothetical protein